jgi:hypothetical protein
MINISVHSSPMYNMFPIVEYCTRLHSLRPWPEYQISGQFFSMYSDYPKTGHSSTGTTVYSKHPNTEPSGIRMVIPRTVFLSGFRILA